MPRITKFETRLRAAFERTVGPENVTLALALIRASERGEDNDARELALQSKRAQQRVRQSFTHTLVLEALNEYLDTCGVEYLGEVDMRNGPPVEYLNVGDPYVNTLLWYRDGYAGRHYHVGGWGDALEVCERRGWIAKQEND